MLRPEADSCIIFVEAPRPGAGLLGEVMEDPRDGERRSYERLTPAANKSLDLKSDDDCYHTLGTPTHRLQPHETGPGGVYCTVQVYCAAQHWAGQAGAGG